MYELHTKASGNSERCLRSFPHTCTVTTTIIMKFEEDDPFNDEASTQIVSEFSASISQFAFKTEEPSTPTKALRRSPRKPTPRRTSPFFTDQYDADSPSLSKKRMYHFDDDEDEKVFIRKSKSSPTKKSKRPSGYAAPEVYAHLSSLPDYLRPSLDSKSRFSEEIVGVIDLCQVVFCGIKYEACTSPNQTFS